MELANCNIRCDCHSGGRRRWESGNHPFVQQPCPLAEIFVQWNPLQPFRMKILICTRDEYATIRARLCPSESRMEVYCIRYFPYYFWETLALRILPRLQKFSLWIQKSKRYPLDLFITSERWEDNHEGPKGINRRCRTAP